jgi:ABC-type molybdate transport system substrate-binding protein
VRITPVVVLVFLAACGPRKAAPRPPITVFAAASLARPLATLAGGFHRRDGVVVQRELGGSVEHARKLTELGRIPDALMLVDDDVIASLVPTHLDWYVRFATNRIVLTYTPRSRFADSVTSENWWRVVSRPGVRLGRADPAVAPVGRHALNVLRRAATYYQSPSLADTLMARASLKYVRPNATELAALLETGEVDYILDYESVARQYGFQFVTLPEDLAVAVLYGIAVPRLAAHPAEAVDFVAFVLSEEGRRILRDASVNVLPVPVAIGTNIPQKISQLARTLAAAPATTGTAVGHESASAKPRG